jgi:transcriptional regulator with XRE-family HTH domain
MIIMKENDAMDKKDNNKKIYDKYALRPNHKIAFKNKLREYREARYMTLTDMATKLGVSVNYLYSIEENSRFPRGVVRARIMAALKCSFDDIFYEVGADPRKTFRPRGVEQKA